MVATNFGLGKPGQSRPSGGVEPATQHRSGNEPPLIRTRTRAADEENFAPLIQVVAIFDDSGSVRSAGEKIVTGVKDMFTYLKNDPQARAMVEVGTVMIADPVRTTEFRPVGECEPPVFTFESSTPLWEAHAKAFGLLLGRRKKCQEQGRPLHKSIVLSITDWDAQDDQGDVLDQIHAAENDKGLRLNFFPIVVGERPNLELAKRVSSKREAAVLKGLNYQSMFVWVTQTIERHAKSRIGEVVKLPATDGWRES